MMGGTWMMYNALADIAMMNMLMHNHGYYYGASPVAVGASAGFFTFSFFIGVLVFAILIGVVIKVSTN